MFKKTICVLIITVLLVTAFAGCKNSKGSQTTTTAPTTQDTSPITLQLYTHSNEALEAAYNKIIEDYKEAAPYVTVNYNIIPMENFTTQLPVLFSTKQAVDIINIHDRYVAPYLSFLSEAPDFVVEDLRENAPASYSASMINGKIYGYLYPDVNMVFVNKKIFADSGLSYPKTWEDMININDQLTKTVTIDGAQVQQYGVNLFWAAGEYVFTGAFWNNVYESLGAKLITSIDGPVSLDKEKAVEAMKLFKDLSYTESNFFFTFAEGRLAVMVGARWCISYLRAFGVEGLDFEVIEMPLSSSGEPLGQGYFQMMVVPNYTPARNQLEAWKLNAYAHDNDGNYILETLGGVGDWRLDTMNRISGEDTVIKQGYDQAIYSSSPLIHEKWADIERIISEALEAYLYGTITAEAAVDQAQQELDSALGQ